MKSMTSKLIWGLTLLIVLSTASAAFAVRGTADVTETVHNLSSGPSAAYITTYKTDETQVCIFCHTPHGGSLDGPLWNRDVQASNAFSFYTSSTISTVVKGVTEISPESLMCLACHDGGLSVNHLLNYGASSTITTTSNSQTNTVIGGSAGANPRIGGEPGDENAIGKLGDDHPISFSYDAVKAEYDGAGRAGLYTSAVAAGNGVQFFGGAGVNRVECSSCHDPHVDYETGQYEYAPFLIMPNTGSALCLACHDK